VTEQFMSTMDGTQLLELTRERSPKTAGVLLTSHAGPDVVLAAVNRGHVVKILLKTMPPLAIRDEITSIALEMVRKR
jgi:DNA-binding NarL/FixJ family response regulator